MPAEQDQQRAGSPVFRAAAVQSYIRGRHEAVLPRFIAQRTFSLLWLLLGLLLAIIVATSLIRVPAYATGLAFAAAPGEADTLVAFLPAPALAGLQPGQPVALGASAADTAVAAEISAVEPQALSLAEARQRYALPESLARRLEWPAAVVVAQVDPAAAEQVLLVCGGTLCQARTQSGTQPLFALLFAASTSGS